LKLASFEGNKQIHQPKRVARLNESRSTGFPQMERVGDALLFAWTQPGSAGSKIITQKMLLNRQE
jgi:hypothetical protein